MISIRKRKSLTRLGCSLTAALASTAAWAENGVSVQNFEPTANQRYMYTESAAPDLSTDPAIEAQGVTSRLFFGADYHLVNEPLVTLDSEKKNRLNTVLDRIQTFDLTAGAEFYRKFSINATLPLNLVKRAGADGSNYAAGDFRIFPKIFWYGSDAPVSVAIIPELVIPTGKTDLFISDGSIRYGARVALEHDFGFLSVAGTAGYIRSADAVVQALDYRQRLPLQLGIAVPLGSRWAINGEAQRIFTLPFNGDQNPSEIYAGARYLIARDLTASAGASIGTTRTIDSADYRVLAGLKYSPSFLAGAEPIPVGRLSFEERPLPVTQGKAVLTPERIFIDEDIKFMHNSDQLTPAAKRILDDVAKVLVQNQDRLEKVRVEGHTNELGSDLYNLRLSEKRAKSVRDYLVSRGVRDDLVTSKGYGKRYPKKNPPHLTRQQHIVVDRRVEFQVKETPESAGAAGRVPVDFEDEEQ